MNLYENGNFFLNYSNIFSQIFFHKIPSVHVKRIKLYFFLLNLEAGTNKKCLNTWVKYENFTSSRFHLIWSQTALCRFTT